MGYGVVNEWANQFLLWVPHSSGYGEDRTATQAVNGLDNPDVSIHTALSIVDVTESENIVHHSTGIMSYVEDGNTVNLGGDPGAWRAYLYSSACTSYVAAFRVKINGGYLRASHFCQFWGDPSNNTFSAGRKNAGKVSAQAVYGEDGFVRHLHTAVDLSGAESNPSDDDALEMAAALGHTGDYRVAAIDAEDVNRRFISIDTQTKRPRFDGESAS